MIITVHCIPRNNDYVAGRDTENLQAICGQYLVRNKQRTPYVTPAFPYEFKNEIGFKRSMIRCGKCLHHEDFPLHLLADIE